jgi:ABC-2 type transport system permease protein
MIDGVIPGWQDNAICIGFGIVTLAIGFLVFKKTQDRFVLYL